LYNKTFTKGASAMRTRQKRGKFLIIGFCLPAPAT
jgi:hypothetical protein